jgi:hypothetical protein
VRYRRLSNTVNSCFLLRIPLAYEPRLGQTFDACAVAHCASDLQFYILLLPVKDRRVIQTFNWQKKDVEYLFYFMCSIFKNHCMIWQALC